MEGNNLILKIIENPEILDSERVPSVFHYKNSDKFFDIINEKREFGERILVLGHEDMDGISSLYGMEVLLRRKGMDFEIYLPSRENEAHGISEEVIKKIKNEGFDFLITVDCGISNEREIKLLRELGFDVFIIDHHSEGNFKEENLIHPFIGKGFPFLSSGVLVFLILMHELKEELWENEDLFDFTYLAGLSVLSDKMPQAGPNEFVLKKSQKIFSYTRIYKIFNEVNLKPPGFKEISKIISTIPAESGSHLIFDFLREKEHESQKKIMKRIISRYIEEQGKFEESMFYARNSYYTENNVTFIVSREINPRYAGWIASRFLKDSGFPVICIAKKNNEWVGEARSKPPFSILKVLREVSFLFKDFGGHPFACGFSIKEENLHPFFENLKKLTAEIKNFIPEPDIIIDEYEFREKRKVLDELCLRGIYFSVVVKGKEEEKFYFSTSKGLHVLSEPLSR